MYLKREKEFQYHPAIIKMLEDVVGGGTIVRADLRTAIFDGMPSDLRTALFDGQPLDELPPFCVVGKDSNGAYHVVKTAKVTEAVEATGKVIKVAKNHLLLLETL